MWREAVVTVLNDAKKKRHIDKAILEGNLTIYIYMKIKSVTILPST